jgi:NADPH:quinone reductase-like Zn-dependent oxidoreductase
MKAAVRSKYGPPEVLSVQEVEKPAPKDDEILIRVYATTVNRSDYHVLTGKPFMMRLFTGLFTPTLSITGSDFAGQVEATGKNAKLFKAGDKVMGFVDMGLQSHAQYLTIVETKVVLIPANVTYDESAACLEGAFYALSGMNYINPLAGQKAMVIGATGAIGSSYVQYFNYYGVHVTAVCSGEHSQLVRALGAEGIIDYQTEDFTKDTGQYDFVFDAVGGNSFSKCRHLLKKGGTFASTGGMMNILLSLVTPRFGGRKVIFPIPRNLIASLNFIKDLVEKGSFKPVIDRKYPIDKIAEAYTYVGSGQKIGNVILTMNA